MKKEEKLKRNNFFKAEILLIKILPFILAFLYSVSTILDYYNIDSVTLNYMSLVILYAFLYLTSYVFNFCEYHRMPLHYIVIINFLSIYDVYIGIPLNNYRLFQMYTIITCLAIFITVYLYVKSNKKLSTRNNK